MWWQRRSSWSIRFPGWTNTVIRQAIKYNILGNENTAGCFYLPESKCRMPQRVRATRAWLPRTKENINFKHKSLGRKFMEATHNKTNQLHDTSWRETTPHRASNCCVCYKWLMVRESGWQRRDNVTGAMGDRATQVWGRGYGWKVGRFKAKNNNNNNNWSALI